MAFLSRAANRKLVEQFVHNSSSMSGNQFQKVLSLFPGPMNRVVLDKMYKLKPKVSNTQLPQVLYMIANRSLDASLPPFLLQQFETSPEMEKDIFSPGQQCLTLYALAKMSSAQDNVTLFDRIVKQMQKKDFSTCSAQEISLALWSLAQREEEEAGKYSELVDVLVREINSRQLSTLSGTEFAKSVHSLAKLKSGDATQKQNLITKCAKYFFDSKWKQMFSPQEFTSVLLAIAPLVPYAQHDRLWENVKTMLTEDGDEVLASWNKEFQLRIVQALEIAAPQLAPAVQERIDALHELQESAPKQALQQLKAEAEWEELFTQFEENPDDLDSEDGNANEDLLEEFLDKTYGAAGIDRRIAEWSLGLKQTLVPTPVGHLLDLGYKVPVPAPVEEEEAKAQVGEEENVVVVPPTS